MNNNQVKAYVKEYYASIAGGNQQNCCGNANESYSLNDKLIQISDPVEQTNFQAADLGLSCGMPTTYAGIQPGDTVLDLGSGAGVDVFRAAIMVGNQGKVIGVDMTPEMVARAQQIAIDGGYHNVDFRLGEIEDLPVDDNSIDIALSNCVINLVPNKRRVFQDVFRVLRPGGQITISDIVTYGEIPTEIRQDLSLWAGCISGAIDREDYLEILRACGFEQIVIHQEYKYNPLGKTEDDKDYGVMSITFQAVKPA